MNRLRSTTLATAVALALLLAACGSNKAETASRDNTTTTAAAGFKAIVVTTAVGQPTAPTVTAGGGGPFCDLARSYSDRTKQFISSLGDPAKVKELVAESGSLIARAQSLAPDEIKADVQRLANSSTQLLAELDKVGYDFTKVPADAVARIQTPEVAASATNLAAYNRRVCGIS